jgi:undecaprenyl-diphosphatase
MWFAGVGVVLSLVVLGLVLAAPLLVRLTGSVPPDDTRRTLWAAGLAAALLWVGHALVVARVADAGGGPVPDDRAALAWSIAHRTGELDLAGRVLALTGGPGAMTALAAVVVVALWLRGHHRVAVVVALTSAGASALVNGLKPLYGRTRPPLDAQVLPYTTYALPSGHAVGSLVVVGVVAAVAWSRPWPVAARATAVTAAAVFVVAVGASRVYLGAHWLTDVLAGWLIGGAWLALGVAALVLVRRREAAQPVSARTSQAVTPPRS